MSAAADRLRARLAELASDPADALSFPEGMVRAGERYGRAVLAARESARFAAVLADAERELAESEAFRETIRPGDLFRTRGGGRTDGRTFVVRAVRRHDVLASDVASPRRIATAAIGLIALRNHFERIS